MSTYWWLRRASYFAFILRELSSIFVGWFAVYLLLLVRAVSQEHPATRRSWIGRPAGGAGVELREPVVQYHAITWFNLAPKAMVVRVGNTCRDC